MSSESGCLLSSRAQLLGSITGLVSSTRIRASMATTTSDGSFMLFGLNLNALGATWDLIGVVCSIEVLVTRSLPRCIGYINFA